MISMTFSEVAKRMGKLVADNSPTIMTAIGVAGTLTTAYLTGKATVKATRAIDDVEYQQTSQGRYRPDPLSGKEKLKLVWKYYIPPVATGVVTVAAIIGANRIGMRRAAAMAAAYSIAQEGWNEYREKVLERLGAKKEEDVRAEVSKARVDRTYTEDNQIIFDDIRSVLCHDSMSGRYFVSDVETIRRAENDINHQILKDMYASLSDLYCLLDLPATSISDHLGWNTDKILEIRLTSGRTSEKTGGRPYVSLEYTALPIRDFDRVW